MTDGIVALLLFASTAVPATFQSPERAVEQAAGQQVAVMVCQAIAQLAETLPADEALRNIRATVASKTLPWVSIDDSFILEQGTCSVSFSGVMTTNAQGAAKQLDKVFLLALQSSNGRVQLAESMIAELFSRATTVRPHGFALSATLPVIDLPNGVRVLEQMTFTGTLWTGWTKTYLVDRKK